MLRVLAPVGLLLVLSSIPTLLIRAIGDARSYFTLLSIERGAGIGMLVILSGIGFWETLWGLVGLNLLCYLFNIYYVSKLTDITIKEQLSDVIPVLLLQSVVILCLEKSLMLIKDLSIWAELFVGLTLPTLFFGGLLLWTKWIDPLSVRTLLKLGDRTRK